MNPYGFTPARWLRNACLLSLLWGGLLLGETKELTVLFTNDIHDHIRADYDGQGGLAFVSGYIKSRREALGEVLILDAGDVAEKGDLLAWKEASDITFRAFSRVGYDAWAPGNHDHDFGIEQLRVFEAISGADMLCINLLNAEGGPEFTPSKIYEKNGIRVGVIGMIVPRNEDCLDEAATAEAMAREAERLRPQVDLVIALCHESVRECVLISRVATEIDLFVSGHSHQALHQPYVVEETGAIIVQAGSYAEYVGEMTLEIDLGSDRIVDYAHRLVPMEHRAVAPDLEMLEWFRQEEAAHAPEANEIVAWTSREIEYGEVGILAAESIRRTTSADIAFNASGQIVRAKLPRGILDANAVFRTGGERGNELVEILLTGAEIEHYVNGLAVSDWYLSQWSGFRGQEASGWWRTGLVSQQVYRVVMPELEWNTRFLRLVRRVKADPEAYPGISFSTEEWESRRLEATWTEAVTGLLREWRKGGRSLESEIEQLAIQSGQEQLIGRGR